MRSVPGADRVPARAARAGWWMRPGVVIADFQLPIADWSESNDESAIGNRQSAIGNGVTRSLPLPVLTSLLQLFFVGEREFHQGIATMNLEFVADVLAV